MARTNPKIPVYVGIRHHLQPATSTAQRWFAGTQFLLAMAAVRGLSGLWTPYRSPTALSGVQPLPPACGQMCHFLQGKLHMLEVLVVESGALATVAAVGLMDGYMVFKPLTMLIAIVFVAILEHWGLKLQPDLTHCSFLHWCFRWWEMCF